MSARPWHVAVTITGVLLLHSWGEAFTEFTRVTETDAHSFVSEMSLAGQRCDSTWHETHILPSASLTFEIRGEPPYTVKRDEYLKEFRAQCRYRWSFPSPSQRSLSLQTPQYGPTIVKVAWSGNEAQHISEQIFFFGGRDLDGMDVTISLVNDGTGVKVQDWWVVGTPTAEGTRQSSLWR